MPAAAQAPSRRLAPLPNSSTLGSSAVRKEQRRPGLRWAYWARRTYNIRRMRQDPAPPGRRSRSGPRGGAARRRTCAGEGLSPRRASLRRGDQPAATGLREAHGRPICPYPDDPARPVLRLALPATRTAAANSLYCAPRGAEPVFRDTQHPGRSTSVTNDDTLSAARLSAGGRIRRSRVGGPAAAHDVANLRPVGSGTTR